MRSLLFAKYLRIIKMCKTIIIKSKTIRLLLLTMLAIIFIIEVKGVINNMATTNINVRVDFALKQEAEALFRDLGLNMSSAITMFLRSAINHDGIPFEVKRPAPNMETRAALDEYEEMRKNPGNYKRYESFDEVLDEVFADA